MAKHSIDVPGTGERGPVYRRNANTLGNGNSRSWRRTINGQSYSFTLVDMPDGEIRWFVRPYNGYPNSRFACAWGPERSWTFKPR